MPADHRRTYEWDDNKRILNLANHQQDFRDVEEFDWDSAVQQRSDRGKETRYTATSDFRGKLHTVVYTERQDAIRVISFRRANKREEILYATP